MHDLHPTRRQLLRLGALGGAALLGAPAWLYAGEPTPGQTEGPFHPLRWRRGPDGALAPIDRRLVEHLDRDSDLTVVEGREGRAEGRVIYVTGRVRDVEDRDLAGIEVEVWQACATGRYNHRGDPSGAALDPNFQYWGRAATDEQGRFLFKTILPGAYAAGRGWVRPPHVHCKLGPAGRADLTTQLYFEGVPFTYEGKERTAAELARLNARDLILDRVPERLRPQVVSAAREPLPGEGLEAGSRVFTYSLVLEPGS